MRYSLNLGIGGSARFLLEVFLRLTVIFEQDRVSETLLAPFKPLFTSLAVTDFLGEPVEIGVGCGSFTFGISLCPESWDNCTAAIRGQGRAFHQSRIFGARLSRRKSRRTGTFSHLVWQ